MKLRKCRKCKTMPILKSEMVFMRPPQRNDDPQDPLAFPPIPDPTKVYYYECECRTTKYCPTEEDAFKAWKHKKTVVRAEIRFGRI
jgi:hypothetical protein